MIRLFRIYCFCFIGLLAFCYTLYLAGSSGLVDFTGTSLIGRDFVNYYSASKLALTGKPETLLLAETYHAWLEAEYGLPLWLNWSYPPHYLFFILPLGVLPYLPAYIVWTIAGGAAFILLTRLSLKHDVPSLAGYLPFLLLSPALVVNAFFGQNGFVTGTLLYLGVRFADSRPVLAGICFGLLTTKPQLGLLIPLVLLLRGYWATILWAGLTAAAIVGLSLLAFGTGMWTGYFEHVVPYQRYIAEETGGIFLRMMPTAFAMGRVNGLEADTAMLLQAPFSMVAVGLTVWTFRKPRQTPELERALLMVCIFMMTPYIFNYDMTALLPAIFVIILGEIRTGRGFSLLSLSMAALYLLPIVTFFVTAGPFVLAACALLLARRIAERRPEPESAPIPATTN